MKLLEALLNTLNEKGEARVSPKEFNIIMQEYKALVEEKPKKDK